MPTVGATRSTPSVRVHRRSHRASQSTSSTAPSAARSGEAADRDASLAPCWCVSAVPPARGVTKYRDVSPPAITSPLSKFVVAHFLTTPLRRRPVCVGSCTDSQRQRDRDRDRDREQRETETERDLLGGAVGCLLCGVWCSRRNA